jgi:hypothetical protein
VSRHHRPSSKFLYAGETASTGRPYTGTAQRVGRAKGHREGSETLSIAFVLVDDRPVVSGIIHNGSQWKDTSPSRFLAVELAPLQARPDRIHTSGEILFAQQPAAEHDVCEG